MATRLSERTTTCLRTSAGISRGPAAVDRQRHGDSHDEEECGEDHVDVCHAVHAFGHVMGPPRQSLDARDIVHEDHYENGKAAENVDGQDAGGSGVWVDRCDGGCGGAHSPGR